MDINIFTAAMRGEFLKAMQAVAEPAPFENVTTVVPSTARIENYSWMTPAPGISLYQGHRRGAQISSVKYSLTNYEYDGMLTVPTRDIEDDAVGGWKLRMGDLAQKAGKPFQAKLAFQTLAAGGATTCFDGSNFFATTHNLGGYAAAVPADFGGGANALTYTSSNTSDATTHVIIGMFTGGSLKPLLLQNRKSPSFNTDAGSPASLKAKLASYWCDLEMGSGFGYWWDAVRVVITNTPSLIDIFACIDAIRQTFMTFQLPKALATDPTEYVHEQTEFSPANFTLAVNPALSQLMRHALLEDRIGVSVAGSTGGIATNIYRNAAGLVVSNYLSSIT
jgi:phage major head subunit gpT-like protein